MAAALPPDAIRPRRWGYVDDTTYQLDAAHASMFMRILVRHHDAANLDLQPKKCACHIPSLDPASQAERPRGCFQGFFYRDVSKLKASNPKSVLGLSQNDFVSNPSFPT